MTLRRLALVSWIVFGACSSGESTREDAGLRPPIGTPHPDASSIDAGADSRSDPAASADGGASDDSGSMAANDASSGGSVEPGTTNTIMGTAPDGRTFDTARTAMWISVIDVPQNFIVYVISAPITCADIQSPGWDARLPAGSQMLIIETGSQAPGTYHVVDTLNEPAPTEAVVRYEADTVRWPGTGGSITLLHAVVPNDTAGYFTVSFANNQIVRGSFDGSYYDGPKVPSLFGPEPFDRRLARPS
jgi:hypothetical protein